MMLQPPRGGGGGGGGGGDGVGAARACGGLLDPRRVLDPQRSASLSALGAAAMYSPDVQIECLLRVLGRPSEEDLKYLRIESEKAGDSLYARVMSMQQRLWGGGGGGGGGEPPESQRLRDLLPHAPPEGLDLLRLMMRIRPAERASVRAALQAEFFRELREGAYARAYGAETAATLALARQVGDIAELHSDALVSKEARTTEGLKRLMEEEARKWREMEGGAGK